MLARELAATFAAEEAEATGSGDGPGVGVGGSGVRVQVLGGEVAGNNERSSYVVYKLRTLRSASPLLGAEAGGDGAGVQAVEVDRRFSSFVELVSALSRETKERSRAAGPGERWAGAHAVVEGWKRALALEKRHTGKASRSEGVVSGRVALLQRLLDELGARPELSTSPSLARFLSADGG